MSDRSHNCRSTASTLTYRHWDDPTTLGHCWRRKWGCLLEEAKWLVEDASRLHGRGVCIPRTFASRAFASMKSHLYVCLLESWKSSRWWRCWHGLLVWVGWRLVSGGILSNGPCLSAWQQTILKPCIPRCYGLCHYDTHSTTWSVGV